MKDKAISTTKTKTERNMTYPSGARRSDNSGKGRYDLISPIGLRRLSLRYEGGVATGKGERNWELGFPIGRCLDSAMRHLNEYREGCREEDHLAAASWQLFCAMHFEDMIARGVLPDELDDLPRYNGRNTTRAKRKRTRKRVPK